MVDNLTNWLNWLHQVNASAVASKMDNYSNNCSQTHTNVCGVRLWWCLDRHFITVGQAEHGDRFVSRASNCNNKIATQQNDGDGCMQYTRRWDHTCSLRVTTHDDSCTTISRRDVRRIPCWSAIELLFNEKERMAVSWLEETPACLMHTELYVDGFQSVERDRMRCIARQPTE